MDVVVAPATPWGHSALAVVRLTGDGLLDVVAEVCVPFAKRPLSAGKPRRVRLQDHEGVFDDGLLWLAAAPATYTGEDTAEVTCHGNPQIVERLLSAFVSAGARAAQPGEFTRRAVLNGKMDLIRAEAVLQVSEATTRRGLEVGRAAMDGTLSSFVNDAQGQLAEAASEYEARMDYPADELAYQTDEVLTTSLRELASSCRELAESYSAGKIWVRGARIALVGAVNAGKSSLFNQLVGASRALVHDKPGTTRDVVETPAFIGGMAVTLLDTAGERQTADPVEAAGLALAQELIDEADLLVVVLRARVDGPSETERRIVARSAERPHVVVYNGVDLKDCAEAPPGAISTVATSGLGMEELKGAIATALVGEEPGEARLVIASARQRDLLLQVARSIDEGLEALPIAGVAVTTDALTRALEELMSLTGDNPREAVLDALFERFCIGK
jgi:tRNA modification GTPase